MIPAFDREMIPKRILAGLSHDGPSLLQVIYGFCGAVDGGQQFFVRQHLKQLTADCKVRRGSGDLYSVTRPFAFAPEPAAEAPPPEPRPSHEGEGRSPSDVSAPKTAPEQSQAADTVSAAEEPQTEFETQPADEETETMQTQTRNTRNGAKNGHRAKPDSETKPTSKIDWVLAVVAETGSAKFSDLMARAKKKGIFTAAGPLGSALCSLTKQKKLKKVERGVYAIPGAKVVFDAAKERKKLIVAKMTKPTLVRKPKWKVKAAAEATAPPVKPGRKPTIFRSVYDELDQKLAAAKAAEKAAVAGINDIDVQIESLKVKRADLVAKRDARRFAVKKLDDSRKRIAEVEAGVAESLKA